MRIRPHNIHFSFFDNCDSSIGNGVTVTGHLVLVVLLFALSQLGCSKQSVQRTDLNSHHVSSSKKETAFVQTSQRQPLFLKDSITTANLILEHHEGNMAGPLTLETLESLAKTNNPTLVQALAQIEGEQAKAQQAGLYPNPRIGYIGEQIGVKGTAGEFQGGFVQQEIVTAGKLQMSREKYRARASAAEFQALAQEYRVVNEVRIRYYRTLGAQKRLAIQLERHETAQDALLTVQEMINVGQANQADLHQAKALLEDQTLKVKMAENDLDLEWEWLMAVVGVSRPRDILKERIEGQSTEIEWEPALQRLLAESPELGLVRAILKEDEITVRREKMEPIPNLILQARAGHSFEPRASVFGVGASIELPIFDWNQGTIRQAQADLKRQQAEVRLTELRLRRSLATQFQQYRTAQQHVKKYQEVILPETRERYATRLRSYGKNRETWQSVLEAQDDFFRRRLSYVDYLVARQEAEVVIDGLLLVDGLTPPSGVPVPGHIDAVPKPR